MHARSDPTALPVVRASELAPGEPQQSWLLHEMWAAGGVGVLGGPPKSCKSWMGLEMAVSVASQTPCLGSFRPQKRGRALLFMAEDSDRVVRARLESLCRHRERELASLDIFVITAPSLRIDLEVEQRRLRATLLELRPDMLLLDPLVRLHRKDENSASEISPMLAYLRELQREFDTAIVLVHHARKNGTSTQLGQSLRGSSDLHAFGDSNLYLQRKRDKLVMTLEHRAAPSPEPLELRLIGGETPHLEIVGPVTSSDEQINEAVRDLIVREGPMTRAQLRDRLQARNARVGEALRELERIGTILRTPSGWTAA